jgi:hypothetical protein
VEWVQYNKNKSYLCREQYQDLWAALMSGYKLKYLAEVLGQSINLEDK